MNTDFIVEQLNYKWGRQRITKGLLKDLIQDVFVEIQEIVAHGDTINIRGFGTFGASDRPGRKYTHPQDSSVIVEKGPATYVSFKPSRKWKELLNGEEE